MVGFLLLALLGSSLSQVFAVELMFNGGESLEPSKMLMHRAMQSPLCNNYHWKYFTRGMKNIDDIKKDFEDHVKKAEDILKSEMEKEDVESRKYWELHQKCLEGMKAVLESVKEMAEERKSACQFKEQELEDMRKLVADCAKTRVRMQQELTACRKSVAKTIEATKTHQTHSKSEENQKKAQENVHTGNQNNQEHQMDTVHHHGSMYHTMLGFEDNSVSQQYDNQPVKQYEESITFNVPIKVNP